MDTKSKLLNLVFRAEELLLRNGDNVTALGSGVKSKIASARTALTGADTEAMGTAYMELHAELLKYDDEIMRDAQSNFAWDI